MHWGNTQNFWHHRLFVLLDKFMFHKTCQNVTWKQWHFMDFGFLMSSKAQSLYWTRSDSGVLEGITTANVHPQCTSLIYWLAHYLFVFYFLLWFLPFFFLMRKNETCGKEPLIILQAHKFIIIVLLGWKSKEHNRGKVFHIKWQLIFLCLPVKYPFTPTLFFREKILCLEHISLIFASRWCPEYVPFSMITLIPVFTDIRVPPSTSLDR